MHEDLWDVAVEDSARTVSDAFQWNLSSAQVGGRKFAKAPSG